jgi:uncharacterized protein with HEPN domain
MQPRSLKLLEDIRDSAAFVCEVTAGKTLDDYRADRLLRQAVERNFEIIGEAVRRLARTDSQTAERIEQHEYIIAFRNILIHGYDLIDHAQVWKVIAEQIPVLRSQVGVLLGEAGSGGTNH